MFQIISIFSFKNPKFLLYPKLQLLAQNIEVFFTNVKIINSQVEEEKKNKNARQDVWLEQGSKKKTT